MSALTLLVSGLKWVSYLAFWCALGLGIYTRWLHLLPMWIVGNAILAAGSAVFFMLLAFQYSNSPLCVLLSRFMISACPSYILGILAFTQVPVPIVLKQNSNEQIMILIFLGSLGLYLTFLFVDRSVYTPANCVLMESYEVFSLMGLAISCLVFCDHNLFGVLSSILFIGFLTFSFHRRMILPLLAVPLFLILNIKTILCEDADHTVNRESLAIYSLIMISGPLLDVFFSKISSIQTWLPVLAKPLCMLRLATVAVLCVETCLLFLVGFSLRLHKEWWVVLPIFAISSVLLWLPFHIVYFVLNWKLWSRVKRCVEILNTDSSRNLIHILSSRGMRHFALISYPLLWINMVITVVQFMWSWTTKDDKTCGLFLICLPIQLLVINFLRELSLRLGGTCCGYALVTPSVLRSEKEDNMREVQHSTTFATRTIRLIQDFFNHHLIDEGGCEYLSERMDKTELQRKLNNFLNMKTKQGNNHDSYLLYYSGPVNSKGDWLMKGGSEFTYGDLMTLWLSHEVSKTSRLLLVLDTTKSNFWVPQVRKTTAAHVGIQTLFVRRDAEKMQEFSIGDFTRDWVDYNCNKDSEVYSDSYRTPIVVTYGISAFWSNFKFQEPTVDEMDKHWKENFSMSLRPLLQLLALFDRNKLCCMCNCVGKFITLMKFWLWTPSHLDIGHGFRFVRFFKVPGESGVI